MESARQSTAPARRRRPAMALPPQPLARRLTLLGWAFPLLGMSIAAILLIVVASVSTVLMTFWVGIPITVGLIWFIRLYADAQRRIFTDVLGVPIARPYRPWPHIGLHENALELVREPATWRDVSWLGINCSLGFAVFLVPIALVANALFYGIAPLMYFIVPGDVNLYGFGPAWRVDSFIESCLVMLVAIPSLAIWWYTAEPMLRWYAEMGGKLLGASRSATLAARVEQLSESRADTVDTQASELRRIERDLHDGAQARLVALGMSLGMAEEMMKSDPDTAAKLLAEARENSGLALNELRSLVRGIHPPVLADRGLGGAVAALALQHPLPVEVIDELSGQRLPEPVESAAYFAVNEVLTNVAKHAKATSVRVLMGYFGDRVGVVIRDNGVGGANAEPGGGLDGVARRLSALDGTVTVKSPEGGPTVITLEIPCELSQKSALQVFCRMTACGRSVC